MHNLLSILVVALNNAGQEEVARGGAEELREDKLPKQKQSA